MNNDIFIVGSLQFWYESSGYVVDEGSMELKSKDRWVRRFVSETYHSI